MGQLMNIVGPLLLLGGAVIVISKRCELLGMCGDDGTAGAVDDTGIVADGSTIDDTASDNPVSGDTGTAGATGTSGVKRTGCCTCGMQGDRVKCHRGDGVWFNPPAGSGGSNDQSVELSLEECNKGCGGTSTGSGSGSSRSNNNNNRTNGAGARASTSGRASIPKKPRLQARGSSSGAGAGAGGNKRPSNNRSSGSSNKRPTSSRPGGAVVKAGASFYSYNPYASYYNFYHPPTIKRSYFVDPYDPRPFKLYHRVGNMR